MRCRSSWCSGGEGIDRERNKQRNTVERGFGRFKQRRGIVTRNDQVCPLTYLGGVYSRPSSSSLAAIRRHAIAAGPSASRPWPM